MAKPSNPELSRPSWVTLPCACANVRRLGRLATRLYDEEIRPAGMETGQFTLLATIRRVPGIAQAHIGRRLGMDSTSLTRTLDVMLKHGWIAKAEGSDRRSRVFTITRAGAAQLERALPLWQRAQRRFALLVGAEGVTLLTEAVDRAAQALSTEVADLPRARRSARKQNAKPSASSRAPSGR